MRAQSAKQTYNRSSPTKRLDSEATDQPLKPYRLPSLIEIKNVDENNATSDFQRNFRKTFSSRKMSGNLTRRTGSFFSKKTVRPRILQQGGQQQEEIIDQFVRKFGKELDNGSLNLSLNKRGKCYFYIGRFLVNIEVSQSDGQDYLGFSTPVHWTSQSKNTFLDDLDENFVETIMSQLKLDESMWIAKGGVANVTFFYENAIPVLYEQFKNDVSDFIGAAEYVKDIVKSSLKQDEYTNQPMTNLWAPTMEVELLSN